MPRGRDELKAYLLRCLERVERVPNDEPWSGLRFPRQDAIKRIKKPGKRVCFTVDPETLSRFAEHRERILKRLQENPTLFGVWLTEVLASWQDEMVDRWLEAHEGHAGESQG